MRVFLILALVFISSSGFAETVAQVVSARGEVKLADKPVRPGDTVPAGGTIKTGADGKAKLLLADKSVVDLGPQTSFTVESSVPDVGSQTRLDSGMVRSSIRKKMEKKINFQMRTKTSVLAVRGTEFIVRSTDSAGGKAVQEDVTVRDGSVGVNAGKQSHNLNPGQQFSAMGKLVGSTFEVPADSLKVVTLDPAALQNLTRQATVEDQTFRQQIEVAGNQEGHSTLQVIASRAASDTTPDREAPNKTDASRIPPIDAGNVGNLNTVDGSAAQDTLVNGPLMTVIFKP